MQGILIGVVIAWTLFFTLIGPEAHGSHFEEAAVAYQAGAGRENPEEFVNVNAEKLQRAEQTDSYQGEMGKSEIEQLETVDSHNKV